MADALKGGHENELMLDLSIGGIFGEPKKTKRNETESVETDDRISNRTKREVRRREVRRKREEKMKKPVDFGSGSCGSVVEDKDWLEKQAVQRNDDVLENGPVWKKERIGKLPQNNASVLTDGFLVNEENVNKKSCVLSPAVGRSFRSYNMNVKADEREADGGGGRRICDASSNGSAGGVSSVYSDGQGSSHQGAVATDDSRSNSSNSQLDHQLASTSAVTAGPYDQPSGSSKQTTINSTISQPNTVNPPETSSRRKEASVLARMPCVSTTGNGPNGRTVSGFLYRYTKNEVSIVCVCHGESFSPAGFVEHAGGVDIAHPLKHITIFPTAFAS